MTGAWTPNDAALIDPRVPNAGRVVNYLDGGRDNFEADRRAAQSLVAAAPIIGLIAPAWHAFFQRVVRYLVREAGVRQFLHVAIALAASNYADEYIWSVDPGCRIALVGGDPLVLAHAQALMRPEHTGGAGQPGGAIGYVRAEVTDPAAILAGAKGMLDFSQPIAIALPFILGFVADTVAAADIVATLAGAVPTGSQVVIIHVAGELNPAVAAAARRWNRVSSQPITLRSKDEVASLVAGLDLVPPGVVPMNEWRPAPGDPHSEEVIPLHAVVARKP